MGYRVKANRDAVVGLDVGSSGIKAAIIDRDGATLRLCGYAVRRLAVDSNGQVAKNQLATALGQVKRDLAIHRRPVYVAISCDSAVVEQTILPRMSLDEVKTALRANGIRHMRQDFSEFYLATAELKDDTLPSQRMKVMVAGAKRSEIEPLAAAVRNARLEPRSFELAAVSPINAFRFSHATAGQGQHVLLLDLGARFATVNFLRDSEPLLTRILPFQAAGLRTQLARALAPVDAAKIDDTTLGQLSSKLTDEALAPFIREIQASLDFCDQKHGFHVQHVFVCGGMACQEAVIEFFRQQLEVPVERWNPIANYQTSHFNGQTPHLMHCAPSLAAAIGVAAPHA